MSRDQVAATVGGPPGVYTREGIKVFDDSGVRYSEWTAPDGILLVWFDRDKRASELRIYPCGWPAFRGRLRARLGL
jgi:hypothetical protein